MKKNLKPTTRQRLDNFLAESLSISRSQAQKMIAGGLIMVNKKLPKKAGDRVKAGDKISVIPRKPQSRLTSESPNLPGTKLKGLRRSVVPPSLAMTPRIIAATPDYVVVNKPTGMLTHPTQANEKNALTAYLLKKYPEVKKVGDDPAVRPGIVHRLDKEASGLLVVARTQPMFDHLKNQFKNRTIEKEYLALVHGKVIKDWDEINFPIARSRTLERMAARPLLATQTTANLTQPLLGKERGRINPLLSKEGRGVVAGEKEARTEFTIEKRYAAVTLLRVIIHTGRMHQIRAHLLAYNHPLVGDPLYFQKKRNHKWDEKCGRLFLHSTKLSFTDLNGEKQTFESSLPTELAEFLKQIKQNSKP